MLRSVFALAAFVLVMTSAAFAQAGTNAVLKGANPMAVVIQDLAEDATREEFTTALIRTDIELELRKAGIRVVGRNELPSEGGQPYLYVFVNTARGALNVYAYNIDVRFFQNATLTRNPDIALSVPTWSRSIVGTERGNRLPALRDKIKEILQAFLNDYLAANPR